MAGSHNAPAGTSFDYFSSVGNQSHQVSCQFHWPLIEKRGHISILIDSSCGRIKLNTESYPKAVSFSSVNILGCGLYGFFFWQIVTPNMRPRTVSETSNGSGGPHTNAASSGKKPGTIPEKRSDMSLSQDKNKNKVNLS